MYENGRIFNFCPAGLREAVDSRGEKNRLKQGGFLKKAFHMKSTIAKILVENGILKSLFCRQKNDKAEFTLYLGTTGVALLFF